MDNNWSHSNTVVEGDKFEIEGLNIWDYKWKDTGKRIIIKGPNDGNQYTFHIFEITERNKTIKFAAGEFSNLVWGIYQEMK